MNDATKPSRPDCGHAVCLWPDDPCGWCERDRIAKLERVRAAATQVNSCLGIGASAPRLFLDEMEAALAACEFPLPSEGAAR